MKVENINIDILKPFEKNPKSHPAEQIDRIVRSIQEFGWANPILALKENNMVIAGHARLKAARKMNLSEVPVIVLDMPYEKAIAYVVADNRLAELAEWDNTMLLPLLDEIKLAGIDVELTGFTAADISLMNKHEVQEDDFDAGAAADAIKEPITKLGDIWILGRHRLMCGDSTKREDVEKLLHTTKPFIMVTDPPYGVEYDPKWRLNSGLNKIWQKRAEGKVLNDDILDWTESYKLFPGHVAYVWHAGRFAGNTINNLHEAGFEIRTQIIWVKKNLVIGRGHYHFQHEPCWYAVRKGNSAKWCGDRKQSTIWEIQNMHRTQGNVDDGKTIHSTQKPIECMARPIRNHGLKDDLVYDPFGGSGTTIMACEQLDRICYMCEIDPIYCDVIVQRFEKFTGQKAHKQEVSP